MKKLLLAMSGGVDSSAAYALLKHEYEVVGVTLILSDNNTSAVCDAKSACDVFGIEHYTYDYSQVFKRETLDKFCAAYLKGLTPNPCVDCNRYVKFAALEEIADSLGAEYIATGHYAGVEFNKTNNRYLLKKAKSSKDQSYALYNLTQSQLSKVVFPLGSMEKEEVRKIASLNGLKNHDKKDSQDLCFVPNGDYFSFIENHCNIKTTSGIFTDMGGNKLGEHSGHMKYTIGQRKGLGISYKEPLYVVAKNSELNRVTLGTNSDLFSDTLVASELNWISLPKLSNELITTAKTRYRQAEQPCRVIPLPDGRVKVVFDKPQRALTIGQSVVFYDNDYIIGGGKIENNIYHRFSENAIKIF